MDSFVQEGFLLLPLKPQPVLETSLCPAGAQVCLFMGLSTLGALSAWHRAKPPACAPPLCWGKDRQGQRKGWLFGSLGRRSTALLCHTDGTLWLFETCSNPTRLHSPHIGLRQRTLCLHSKSWLFTARQSILSPMVISRNLTCNTGPAPSLPCSALS